MQLGGTPMSRMPELYACLYAKEFPAQSLLRLRLDIGSQACVVLEGEPPLQTVCSLNPRARVLGAEREMTRVEVDTLPPLHILSHRRRLLRQRYWNLLARSLPVLRNHQISRLTSFRRRMHGSKDRRLLLCDGGVLCNA